MNPIKKTFIEKHYDFVVIGGGISGMCAAISAARGGATTALIHNRPVLGGNASSEVRMHICGAHENGRRLNARETGIIEELLLDNKAKNPQHSYSVLDTVFWEKVRFQENLDLYLNTHIDDVMTEDGRIISISGIQQTTEKRLVLTGDFFLDSTGDGTISYLAGASYMHGREGKDRFREAHAPDEADDVCMGNTLLFSTKRMESPVPFKKPAWANSYTEEDLAHREHSAIGSNYWWIELGGDDLDTIDSTDILRDELLKAVYGIWDHVKNGGNHGAENYALDWIGFLPGKRESRRIIGDYIINENDLMNNTLFNDAVAYGGWPMDMHIPGGLKTKLEPTEFIKVPELYSIPYRSLYSKDINNLLIGGRIVSASRMAFGSMRVMATCAVIGQAIGTSIPLLKKYDVTPRDLVPYIKELQQQLLKDDAYIPGIRNKDEADLASDAKVSASSTAQGYKPENVIDGIARNVKETIHCWSSDGEEKAWIHLTFDGPIEVSSLKITFDSNLSIPITHSMFNNGQDGQPDFLPITLVKDFDMILLKDDVIIHRESFEGNHQRRVNIELSQPVVCDTVKFSLNSTYGCPNYRIFEIRAYK